MIETLLSLTRRVVLFGVWASGAMLIVTSLIITADVALRKLFGISLGISHELAGYALAISSVWAYSFTLLNRGHIRIDIIYNYLPTKPRLVLDFTAMVATAFFMAVTTYYGFLVLKTTIQLNSHANTPLGTPLWIPQSAWFAGLCVFMLVVVLLSISALRAVLRGNLRRAHSLIGLQGADEEVQDEMREAKKVLDSIRGNER